MGSREGEGAAGKKRERDGGVERQRRASEGAL
jgi:hypothetical protein